MAHGTVPGDCQPVQAGEPFLPRALHVGKFVLGPLAGQGHFGCGGLARAQGHHPVLRRANAGVEGLFEIVAADVDEVPALLLACCPALQLVGDFEEVGGGAGVEPPRRCWRGWMGRQVEQTSAGTMENRSGGVGCSALRARRRVRRGESVARPWCFGRGC